MSGTAGNQRAAQLLTNQDAELIADHIVDKLLARAADEETVQKIVEVWGGVLDQHIGKSVRRFLWLVMTAVFVYLGVKFDVFVKWIAGGG